MYISLSPIMWREFKINLFNIGRVINNFLVPIFILVFFGLTFSKNIGRIPYENITVRYDQFLLPGIFALQIFMCFPVTFAFVRLDREKRITALIITSKTPINFYFIGKLVSNVLIMVLRIMFLALIGYLLVKLILPIKLTNIFIVLVAIILGTTVWLSLGFMCGVFISREDIRDIVFSLMTFPLTFASSIYYNVKLAPKWIKLISELNPLTYICNLLRKGFLLQEITLWDRDLAILLFFAIFTFILAYFSSKRLTV